MMYKYAQCSLSCAKGLLMLLNGICILIAFCTFAFAVIDTRILKQYGEEQANGTFIGDMTIILASLLLVMVATFGCYGAARENVKILYLYVGFLMVLMILELLISIFVSVQRYGLAFRVTDWMREDFYKNVTDGKLQAHNKLWDDIQSTYECCGLNGPEDYPALGHPISLSCCPRAFRARTEVAQQQMYSACLKTYSYNRLGCEEAIVSIINESADCLLGISLICITLEAAGMLLAMWMANNLKNIVQEYTYEYNTRF